ncbi:MAG: hypothetical protein NUW00_05360, partial [Candidatus Kaiserbacteria bacterium]|nr:hypothetical protein [Candidatus Kaiserbacteria bacterium]
MAKVKRLKFAKKHAFWVTTSHVGYIDDFTHVLNAKYGPFLDMVRGIARASCTSMYFLETEDEVIQKLNNIGLPKKGKTADCVIVRMVLSRLLKLHKSINMAEARIKKYPTSLPSGNNPVPVL